MKLSKRTLIVGIIAVHLAVAIALGAIAISTPVSRNVIYVSLALGAWLGLIAYSRWRWPRLACRACDGTGKAFEPLVFRIVCLRWSRRAWRPCRACRGAAWDERPKGLNLR